MKTSRSGEILWREREKEKERERERTREGAREEILCELELQYPNSHECIYIFNS